MFTSLIENLFKKEEIINGKYELDTLLEDAKLQIEQADYIANINALLGVNLKLQEEMIDLENNIIYLNEQILYYQIILLILVFIIIFLLLFILIRLKKKYD